MTSNDPRVEALQRCLSALATDERQELADQLEAAKSPRLAMSPHAPAAAALQLLLQDGLADRLAQPDGAFAMPFQMLCVELSPTARSLVLAALDALDQHGAGG